MKKQLRNIYFHLSEFFERKGAWAICVGGMVVLLLAGCEKRQSHPPAYTDAQRLQLDTTANHTKNIDSLQLFVEKYRKAGDRCREMASLAALGHGYQTASRYADAVKAHQRQLELAEELDDTLMKVSALNDIGVNYRRLGLHYDGMDNHLRAVETSLQYPDEKVSEKMLKCRAIGYNGIGNVYLSIGNYQKADEMLRKALALEKRLGSHLGMNVDLSNLGTIYERRGMLDSAWRYYKESMHHSELANSYTGKAYGHMNFGRLHALKGHHLKAIEEYKLAQELLHTDRDLWLWLQPALALSEAFIDAGMADSAVYHLERVEAMAHSISTKEYQAKIDRLRAKLLERQGKAQAALELYRKAVAHEDSMLNLRDLFEIETLQRNTTERYRAKVEEERRGELVRQKWIGRIALAGLIVACVLLGLGLYIYRIRRRNHLALKQMSAVRENFFTNITHEFRTPLMVILGLSHELQDNDAESVREKAKTIERQGKGLNVLINQLLDISKIKSSVGNPDWHNGNVTTYVAMILETYRDYARSQQIDLAFFAKDEVRMDFVPDYVQKVMNNLLSNALKFTPENGRVSVTLWREEKQLKIEVADTGMGMNDEIKLHIFEPFYQAESDSRNIGTGVGLALVKQIIEAVKGEIRVESTVGKGTTFHVSIPIHNHSKKAFDKAKRTSDSMIPAAETSLANRDAGDSQCRLLIIEDHRDIAAYIGTLFAERYAITYAKDGKEGLEKALELMPDLIITDLMMPVMDGLEVCRQVRSNEITNHIPIIVVTAKITEEERIRGIEAGADAYLAKPFNSEELHTRVEALLHSRRMLREKFATLLVDPLTRVEEAAVEEDDVDLRFLNKVGETVALLLGSNQEVEVSAVAARMCMSSRQFQRKMVALTGYTPTAYFQRLRIQKAKEMLDANPTLSFSEVAERSGYNDYSNFVRAFKNILGTTPTEYRKREEG